MCHIDASPRHSWDASCCSASPRRHSPVATPVLAGRVVDAIVHRAAPDVVVGLASLIAATAF